MTVKVTREENKSDPVEVKVGDEVAFINATGGGHAHLSFEGNDAVQFNVGHGGRQITFAKPGTYPYTVHITGVKAHAHTGTVIVKYRRPCPRRGQRHEESGSHRNAGRGFAFAGWAAPAGAQQQVRLTVKQLFRSHHESEVAVGSKVIWADLHFERV